MANNKDFIVKNAVEVGGPTKVTVGDAATGGSYTAGYDLSAAAYDSVSFSVSTQEAGPSSVFFKDDGTKMYIIGYNGDEINEYSLSTAWDITTASASSVLSVSSYETLPRGLVFKTDGTSLYFTGLGNDQVRQYDMTTAWDISTASYSKTFSVSSQETSPSGLFFKSDGTKMYVSGQSGVDINEYTLSTAWDVSTASYSQNFSISSEFASNSPQALFFKSDGTKVFVVGRDETHVVSYTLSTAWDISTASYDGTSFSVATQDGSPYGVFLKSDGLKMYIAGDSTNTIYQYTTGSTVTTGSFDLSTGNYFTDTPSADVEYTFSNAGDVQSFQLELAPPTSPVLDNFAITLYTGNGSSQDITNNIDLATDGGLVWTKIRSSTISHCLEDTVRPNKRLSTDTTGAEISTTNTITSYSTTGYSISNNGIVNDNGSTYVSWAFKKAEGFMDIQTWTGNGTAGRTISHNLNADVGMIIVKNLSSATEWRMYNRGYGGTYGLSFPTGNSTIQSSAYWNDTDATTTEFTLGNSSDVNGSGSEYVAYIFAHNSQIQVGIYNGDGTTGREIETGFSPQYVVLGVPTSGTWLVFDTQRGINDGAADPYIRFQEPEFEDTDQNYLDVTTNGFTVGHVGSGSYYNNSGSTFLYIAINSGEGSPTITWDADIAWPSGTAPDSPAAGEKDIYTFTTDDGGTTYIGVQSGDAFS